MENYREFLEIVDDLIKNETVNIMKQYKQHGDISTFDHCKNVAFICYLICKKLNLDYISVARAGMLHDLFLYDWHEKRPIAKFTELHAFKHPKMALENARKITALNEIEEDIIIKHMWPVTIRLPKYKESFIITLVDKYSAVMETVIYNKKRLKRFIKRKSYGI